MASGINAQELLRAFRQPVLLQDPGPGFKLRENQEQSPFITMITLKPAKSHD
jgi:hypothetical protein